jgi:small subunit ribosomal protein S6
MALYELVIVLDGQQTDDDINALIKRVETHITDAGGEITDRDDWGRRKLAYKIRGKSDGFYSVFYFTMNSAGAVARAVEHMERIEETVLRHMIIRVPKTKKPIPRVTKPDSSSDNRPDWGVARRGFRPPPRGDRYDRGGERPDRGERHDRDDRGPRRDGPPASAAPAPAAAVAAPPDTPAAAPGDATSGEV